MVSGLNAAAKGNVKGVTTVSIEIPFDTSATSLLVTPKGNSISIGNSIDLQGSQALQFSSAPTNNGALKPFPVSIPIDIPVSLPIAMNGNSTATIATDGLNVPIDITPASLTLNYIICLHGIYPVRRSQTTGNNLKVL